MSYLDYSGLSTLWAKIKGMFATKIELATKQNTLTFDTTPTANSTNPVTSDGVKAALDAKANQSTTYTKEEINNLLSPIGAEIVWVAAEDWPLATGEANAIYCVQGSTSFTCYGWTGSEFQELATYNWIIDATPTKNSSNPVSSGGVWTEFDYISVNFTEARIVSNNILAPDMYEESTKFLRRTNGTTIVETGGFGYTDFIPIDSKGLYCNCTLGTSGTYKGGIIYYNSSKVYLGYKSGKVAETSDFEGAAYVIFNLGDPTNLPSGQDYAVYRSTTELTYDEYRFAKDINLPNKSVTAEKLADGVVPDVVDNLTTNSSTKTLSAAQGKLIADTTMELTWGQNILNPSAIVTGKYIKFTDGKEANATGDVSEDAYGYTPLIPLLEEGLICNSSFHTYGANLSGCIGYDANGEFLDVHKGASSHGSYVSVTPTGDFVNVKYVRFNLYNNANNQYAVYKGTTLPSSFVPYVAPYYAPKQAVIGDGTVTTSKLATSAVTTDKVDFVKEVVGKNKCNPNDPNFKLNYYINVNSGKEVQITLEEQLNKCGVTGYIPISTEGMIINHWSGWGAVAGWAIYDSSYTYIRGATTRDYVYDSTTDSSAAYIRFTFNYAYSASIQVEEGNVSTDYTPYEIYNTLDETKVYVPVSEMAIVHAMTERGYYPSTVDLSLPDKIYAVRGDKIQVFYQGIVVVPDIEVYDISVTCSKGKAMPRYWEWDVPDNASVGNVTWAIAVKDANGNVLASNSCQLVVVDKGSSPVSAKNILCIGDSLTAGGTWPSEMKRRLVGDVGTGTPAALGLSNVNFIGSQSVTPSGRMQVNIEGHSGWSWDDYDDAGRPRYRFYLDGVYDVVEGAVYTNNSKSYTVTEVNNESGNTIILTSSSAHSQTISGSTLTKSSGSGDSTLTFTQSNEEGANPFWNTSLEKLDFVNYVETACGLSSGTKIDFAYFLMTWNGVPDPDADWSTFMGYAKTVIDALHADYPDCKIKLLGVEFPYPPTFISAGTRMGFTTLKKAAKMNEMYQELANSDEESGESGDAYSDFVEFVNVSSQFDGKYNMTNSERDANTRNSTYKERYTNNSIHPATSGYLQIADVAYRNICNEL